MNNLLDKIKEAYNSGKINSYMAERLAKASEFGMTDQLLDDALMDAEGASGLGVDNDKDYNVRFVILNLADDILDDTFGMNMKPDDKHALCEHALHTAKEKDMKCDNLTDYRLLIHNWLNNKHTKKAYPNTQGKFNREPEYDIMKWTNTAYAIYELLNAKKISREDAVNLVTASWDADEQFKFKNWLRYYESGNTEKYNVKTANINKQALDFTNLNLPEHLLDPNVRSNQLPTTLDRPQEKTKKEQELDQAKLYKAQMRSRLRSLKKILDKYNDILPHQNVESIQDEMFALDKSINRLNIYAFIQDRIVLSANRLQALGFEEGATMLKKFAQEPEAPPAPVADFPVGEEVIESMPEPTDPNPQALNPSALVNLQTIISRLEGVGKKLKSRDTIRELASIDILLNELGMASYFPELTDAQSKLIESYGYASNKVESIVAKLRGSGSSAKSPAQPQPPKQMSAEELRAKPVGKVKKQMPTG